MTLSASATYDQSRKALHVMSGLHRRRSTARDGLLASALIVILQVPEYGFACLELFVVIAPPIVVLGAAWDLFRQLRRARRN